MEGHAPDKLEDDVGNVSADNECRDAVQCDLNFMDEVAGELKVQCDKGSFDEPEEAGIADSDSEETLLKVSIHSSNAGQTII